MTLSKTEDATLVRIGRFHSLTKAGMQQRNENMFLKKSCDGSRKVGYDRQNRRFPKRKTQNLPFRGNHRFAMIGPAFPIFKVMTFEIQHAVESKVHQRTICSGIICTWLHIICEMLGSTNHIPMQLRFFHWIIRGCFTI